MDILKTISTIWWALIIGVGALALLGALYFLKFKKKRL